MKGIDSMKNKDKKKCLCILALVMIFILFLIVYIVIPHPQEQSEDTEISSSAIVASGAGATDNATETIPESDIEQYTNEERIRLLKSDAKSFLNTYTSLPDGTYESEKEKFDTLSTQMTSSAIEKYLNEELLKDPSAFNNTAQVTAKITNRSVAVYYSMSSLTSKIAKVCIICKQSVESSGTTSEYPYHFIGTFRFDSITNSWKCDEIETSTSYSEN